MVETLFNRQQPAGAAPVAAFDFDGTLTTQDSFLAFVAWRAGPARFAIGLATLAPAALGYLIGRDRGRLKAALVRRFLKGARRAALEADAEAFAERHASGLLRDDALEAWRGWRARGARLLIVTASPEPVVAPFARRLGADLLIGTRLAFDAGDRATGDLDGPNCRGAEKARRLRAALGQEVRLSAAYGDTAGDREMLALAEEAGMKVFKGKGRRS